MVILTQDNFQAEIANAVPLIVLWSEPMSVAGSKLFVALKALESPQIRAGMVDTSAQAQLAISNSIVQAPWLVVYVNGMPVAQGASLTPEILHAVKN